MVKYRSLKGGAPMRISNEGLALIKRAIYLLTEEDRFQVEGESELLAQKLSEVVVEPAERQRAKERTSNRVRNSVKRKLDPLYGRRKQKF